MSHYQGDHNDVYIPIVVNALAFTNNTASNLNHSFLINITILWFSTILTLNGFLGYVIINTMHEARIHADNIKVSCTYQALCRGEKKESA